MSTSRTGISTDSTVCVCPCATLESRLTGRTVLTGAVLFEGTVHEHEDWYRVDGRNLESSHWLHEGQPRMRALLHRTYACVPHRASPVCSWRDSDHHARRSA